MSKDLNLLEIFMRWDEHNNNINEHKLYVLILHEILMSAHERNYFITISGASEHPLYSGSNENDSIREMMANFRSKYV